MAGQFNREDLAKLEQLISSIEALTARQEEIIGKVCQGEQKIGELRLGYLKQYFDEYSTGLDSIITRKTSQLSDAFLVAENKFLDSLEEQAAVVEKATYGHSSKDNNSSSKDPRNGKDRAVGDILSDDQRSQMNVAKDLSSYADELAELFRKTEEERRNDLLKDAGKRAEIADNTEAHITKLYKSQATKKQELEETQLALEIARYGRQKNSEIQIAELTGTRLNKQQEAFKAELDAQLLLNKINNEIAYAKNNSDEAGEVNSRIFNAKEQGKQAQQLADAFEKERAKRHLYYARKNNGILSKEDAKRVEEELAKKFKQTQKGEENLAKQRARLQKIAQEKQDAAERDSLRSGVGALTKKGASIAERKEALYELTHNETGNFDMGKTISATLVALSDLAKQLEKQIDDIAKYKGAIDTRLQGSSNKTSGGSYWDQITKDLIGIGAINPYFKQQDFANNVKKLVTEVGIAFNIEQRAFLDTIKDKIAGTFKVTSDTLLRLVRIQQEDSTAGRLGMESALNAFLNNMFETTEYLQNVADSVRTSLTEMEALMQGAEAAEVEYQVQKWLGSLYSVGMSQEAVNAISSALGQVASGQIEGITNGGTGNLLVMAANDAGVPIADILTQGIDASNTNALLQASVNYLAELAESSKDNKVVQQQLAKVFGVKASDLKAVTNLASKNSIGAIFNESKTYEGMLNQLFDMAGSMGARTSMAEMMTNFWENGKYTLSSSMASNPVSYFIYKMASVLDDAAGGIDLPFVNVMGFGVDLNTTVSDLMRVAAVGTGILGSIGPLISGLGSSFSGQAMLNKLGINASAGLAVTPRGEGISSTPGSTSSGTGVSSSGYVGNSSGSDVKNSTIQEAEDSKKQQMIEAKEEEEANQVTVLNTTVLKIYELLDDVANGKSCFRVKVEGYGLTKSNSGLSNSLGNVGGSNYQGGVNALSSLGGSESNMSSSSSTGSTTSGSLGNNGVGGNISLGGWTTA